MKHLILFLISLTILFSGKALSQDIQAIFNNNLTLDDRLSQHTNAVDGTMAIYGEVKTKIYSYKGSFEEAVNTMKVPHNANVSTVTNQSLGNSIGLFILVTEELDPKPMQAQWYDKARKKVNEYTNTTGKSLSITIDPYRMHKNENLQVGKKIELRIINLSNPYVDFDNLKVVKGTWVSEMVISTLITPDMLADKSEGFEAGWDEEEMDMGVKLPSGVHFVEVDEVADSEWLQGDVNYLVEMSADKTINFFKNNKERFINSFEQSELISQEGAVMTTFYLLEHKGELKAGDDVLSLTIQPAPKSILSDVLGRNQGIWTLISISRWTEEND